MNPDLRCPWAGNTPIYQDYHDTEWGVPLRDGLRLWEMLILEGAQAGLSWITILRRRETYRAAFDGFDPERIARYGPADTARLLADPGIIRNRLKIAATIGNARAFLEFPSPDAFSHHLWSFTGGQPVTHHFHSLAEIPPHDEISDAMSRDLKRRGFRFVGSTICYAFMQAVGMVNDHLVSCPRHAEITRLPAPSPRPGRKKRN